MADTQTAPPADAAPDTKQKRAANSAANSAAARVYTAAELKDESKKLVVLKDVSRLNWKINTSPTTSHEPDALKKPVTTPPISKLDIKFPTGLTVTARNKKGVTVKDCLDAIWKQFRKKADDELDLAILDNLYFDSEDLGYGTLGVQLKKEADSQGKKKK